ncbi:uncharacterized protein B0H64DRAFT_133535 [Chaetomium fimeti]|uniref:Uncharacterized protein n=1 Tax=Chaetomium fimeti TaxID=1854472 RepID=A0AAE0HJX8_9PEZI|nr:hypothetical protein B0H64DRAFT_133535 [Chaetomium fimeti]
MYFVRLARVHNEAPPGGFRTSRISFRFSPHEAATPLDAIVGKQGGDGPLDVGSLPAAGSTPDFATVNGRAPWKPHRQKPLGPRRGVAFVRNACHSLPRYHHVAFCQPIHRPSNNILDRRKGSKLNKAMSRRPRSCCASGPAKKTPVETAVSIDACPPARHSDQVHLETNWEPSLSCFRSFVPSGPKPSRPAAPGCFSFQWGKITPDFDANPHSATRGRNGATLTLGEPLAAAAR